MFWITVLKRLGGGSRNLVTFNINLWSIKTKIIFGSLQQFTQIVRQNASSPFPHINVAQELWQGDDSL